MNRVVPVRQAPNLRVCFVAPFGLRHKTTVWARTLPIAQQLVKAGHDANILVPPWDSPEDAGKAETVGGVSIEHVRLAGGLLPTVARLLAAIRHAQPHVVHIVKPRAHAGLVQWWLWQRRHHHPYSVVLDVDDWEQAWNPINRYGWLTSRFLTWQEEWGIRHADAITAASRWLEAKVNWVAPTIPRLFLPNGVEPLPAAPNAATTDPAAPRILFFTRFVEVTPGWLHEFWAAVRQRLPAATLVIAGKPVQPALEAEYRAALRQTAHIEWLGYVPADTLPALYARTTCAIFPAQPIPLLQAKCSVRLATTLLYGVPVVASAVGEQVNYGAAGAARLVPADAPPAAFADAVIAAIQHASPDRAAREAATRHMLDRYAWSKLAAPLPDFYRMHLRQR